MTLLTILLIWLGCFALFCSIALLDARSARREIAREELDKRVRELARRYETGRS